MDPQWDVRRRAADALGGIGPAAKDAIEELRALLADEEPLVRVAAATALTKVSSAKLDTVVPSVATLLRDPHPGVRAAVADLLGNLLSASQGGSVSPRDAERIRRVATQFIPALTEVLGDCDYRVRMAAVQALGQAGPLATEALPAVTLLLRDGIPDVRSAAVAALLRIKGQ
jgi:HEAT repeat protein